MMFASILLTALGSSTFNASGERAYDIAVTNVDVITMGSEAVLADQTILIRDGKIQSIHVTASKQPHAKVVIDANGKFALPGLTDMHIHVEKGEEADLFLYLAHGVTTLQSMHGSEWHLELKKRLAAGKLEGPRLFTTGPTTATEGVNTPEKAEAFVKAQKQAGYDAVKQYGSGRGAMSLETYQHLADACRREGIRLVGHAPRNLPFTSVLQAGQDSVDHAEEIYYTHEPLLNLYRSHVDFQFGRLSVEQFKAEAPPFPPKSMLKKEIELLADQAHRSGLSLTPTLIAFDTIRRQTTSEYEDLLRRKELELIHPAKRFQWSNRNTYRSRWETKLPEMSTVLQNSLWVQGAIVKEFATAGVPILAGSDAPLPFVFPGESLHRELELLVDCGLTPYDALRAATISPAIELGIEDSVGTLAVGKQADILLVDANPLQDIRNARNAFGVIANGQWYSKTKIAERLEVLRRKNERKSRDFDAVQELLDAKAIELALLKYRALGADDPLWATHVEAEVNSLAYKLLREAKEKEAIEAFELNTRYFPESWNVWDSLGEACEVAGDRASAIKNFKKSLELNPNNQNAIEHLKSLHAPALKPPAL